MADIDIDPFGEHESRPEESTEERVELPESPRGLIWEPEHEQEASFRGTSQRTRLVKDYVKDLYEKLSKNIGEPPEVIHYDILILEVGNCTTGVRMNP